MTLSEFQKLTGISDSALGHFVKHFGHLCTVNKETGIEIDPEQIDTRTALDEVFELRKQCWIESKESIEALISRIIGENMESIIEESLTPFTQDLEQDCNKNEAE